MLLHFEDYLRKEKRYSEHTVVAYTNDVKKFFELFDLDPNNSAHLKDINRSLVRSWMVDNMKNDITPKSIQRKLSSNRMFYKFLLAKSFVELNPFTNVKGPKVAKRLPEFVQKKDIDVSKTDQLFSNDIFGQRDKLLFEILYQTGIRLSECIHIKESDISANQIKVLGKRNKERIIAIGDTLYNSIAHFCVLKQRSGIQVDFLLFTDSQKKMYPKFVYRKINYYLSHLVAIKKRSPHVLRHTFATHLLNEGASLEVLKEILGHANLAATQVYTHNSFEQISSIYKSAHPREYKN
jgi:integrase/recombinase XerC